MTVPSQRAGVRFTLTAPAASLGGMSIMRPALSLGSAPARTALVGGTALLCSLLGACGAPATLPENVLFREASLALEDESYSTAIANYKKLLEEYPFSDRAEIASLNIAYAYYLKLEYGAAIASFNDFERLYPVSPLLPFVSYTIGLCWLDQAKAGDRDPSFSSQALLQFRKVATEYPNSIYADLSVFRQAQAQENLAAHEIVVGDYYEQRKNLTAAAGRYDYVVRKYPTTETAARAAEKLALVNLAIAADPGETAKAVESESAGPAPDKNQYDPMIADDGDSAADIGVVDVDPSHVETP